MWKTAKLFLLFNTKFRARDALPFQLKTCQKPYVNNCPPAKKKEEVGRHRQRKRPTEYVLLCGEFEEMHLASGCATIWMITLASLHCVRPFQRGESRKNHRSPWLGVRGHLSPFHTSQNSFGDWPSHLQQLNWCTSLKLIPANCRILSKRGGV